MIYALNNMHKRFQRFELQLEAIQNYMKMIEGAERILNKLMRVFFETIKIKEIVFTL